MVITNASCMGNCLLLSSNEKSTLCPDGVDMVLGMKVISPSWSPPMRCTSKTLAVILSKTILVPLHKPIPGARLHRSMRGQPSLRWSLPGGRPKAVNVWRNSGGKGLSSGLVSAPASVITESALQYTLSSPFIFANTTAFDLSTSLFHAASIICLRKYDGGGTPSCSMEG